MQALGVGCGGTLGRIAGRRAASSLLQALEASARG